MSFDNKMARVQMLNKLGRLGQFENMYKTEPGLIFANDEHRLMVVKNIKNRDGRSRYHTSLMMYANMFITVDGSDWAVDKDRNDNLNKSRMAANALIEKLTGMSMYEVCDAMCDTTSENKLFLKLKGFNVWLNGK